MPINQFEFVRSLLSKILIIMGSKLIICLSQFTKAELLQEGIFFPHPFICQRRFSNEKVGNLKIKPTFIISVLKVEY